MGYAKYIQCYMAFQYLLNINMLHTAWILSTSSLTFCILKKALITQEKGPLGWNVCVEYDFNNNKLFFISCVLGNDFFFNWV